MCVGHGLDESEFASEWVAFASTTGNSCTELTEDALKALDTVAPLSLVLYVICKALLIF